MKIRRFVVKVACYDENPPGEKQLEDAIEHGMMENAGPASVQFIDERQVDHPDVDYKLPAHELDHAMGEWDRRAEEEVYGS